MEYNQRARAAIAPANSVGRVARIYGKQGELVVQRRDGFPKQPDLLWIEADGIGTPLWVRSCVNQGASKVVVVFEDFSTEELSAQLLGKELYAEGIEFEEPEEAEGLALLIGFSFVDQASGKKGQVVEAYDSQMNPLLGVELEGSPEEFLVPWAQELVEQLDEKKRRLSMRLTEGFFEEFAQEPKEPK